MGEYQKASVANGRGAADREKIFDISGAFAADADF